jgi:hypothetical protein
MLPLRRSVSPFGAQRHGAREWKPAPHGRRVSAHPQARAPRRPPQMSRPRSLESRRGRDQCQAATLRPPPDPDAAVPEYPRGRAGTAARRKETRWRSPAPGGRPRRAATAATASRSPPPYGPPDPIDLAAPSSPWSRSGPRAPPHRGAQRGRRRPQEPAVHELQPPQLRRHVHGRREVGDRYERTRLDQEQSFQ